MTDAPFGQFNANVVIQAASNIDPSLHETFGNVDVSPAMTVSSPVQKRAPSTTQIKSMVVGPSLLDDPLVAVVLSLSKQVTNQVPLSTFPISFRHISTLDINYDTPIPSYFNDNDLLIHLAFLLPPQLGGEALEKIARDYLDEDDEDEEDP